MIARSARTMKRCRLPGASGLTDVKVTERWYYAYIGDVFCTDVEGVVYTVR